MRVIALYGFVVGRTPATEATQVSSVIPLGTFTRVSLRDAWPTEDGNFTPWLAQADAIRILGETLGLALEIEAVEHWVGPFRADILAHIAEEADAGEHRVIIENQFGRSNHGHLGQILTYLAGIEGAKTVVWIAETFQPDHRAAIDWLNANTGEEFSFFAIEMELWRIDNSPPAPRFNIIASPNDWTKVARRASSQVGEAASAEGQHVRLAYWSSFSDFLKQANSAFRSRRPTKGNVLWFPTGRSGTVISAIINIEKNYIGVALYTDKIAFPILRAEQQLIDQAVGDPLDWQELPGQKRSRVNLYKLNESPSDETRRSEQHAWLLAKMERFRSAFVPRLKMLPPRNTTMARDSEEPEDEA
jgi:hypothetical protein